MAEEKSKEQLLIEEKAKEINDKHSQIEATLKEVKEGKADGTDLEALKTDMVAKHEEITKMFGEEKGLKEYVEGMQKHIDKLEAAQKEWQDSGRSTKSMEEQIHELVKDENFIKDVKNRNQKDYTVKADVTRGSFSAASGTTALEQMYLPGIVKHPWAKTPVFAATPSIMVGEKIGQITWLEENSRTDNAGFKAENTALDQSDVTWIHRVENFYKLGHYVTFTEESIEDSDYVQSELNDLLTNGVYRKAEIDLIKGTGSANNWKGLIPSGAERAKAFSNTLGTSVTAPNEYDVIRAAVTQVALGNNSSDANKQGYQATVALVHPTKMAVMDLQKDTNNNYIMPPFRSSNGMEIAGVRVLPSLDLDADQFLIGDFERFKKYIKRNLTIKTSENVASNFLADAFVIKATMRAAVKLPTLEEFAFVFGTFAAAKTALST